MLLRLKYPIRLKIGDFHNKEGEVLGANYLTGNIPPLKISSWDERIHYNTA